MGFGAIYANFGLIDEFRAGRHWDSVVCGHSGGYGISPGGGSWLKWELRSVTRIASVMGIPGGMETPPVMGMGGSLAFHGD